MSRDIAASGVGGHAGGVPYRGKSCHAAADITMRCGMFAPPWQTWLLKRSSAVL